MKPILVLDMLHSSEKALMYCWALYHIEQVLGNVTACLCLFDLDLYMLDGITYLVSPSLKLI